MHAEFEVVRGIGATLASPTLIYSDDEDHDGQERLVRSTPKTKKINNYHQTVTYTAVFLLSPEELPTCMYVAAVR